MDRRKGQWYLAALFWFFVVAVMGVILRSASLFPVPFNYSNLLHAHSHLAFLGWVFTALFALIIHSFQPAVSQANRIQFSMVMFANAGMVVSFSLGGYNFYSILFSTLHMMASIWFVAGVMKHTSQPEYKKLTSVKFLRAGMIFLLLSSLGPFSMPLIKMVTTDPEVLRTAVLYYLHFQISGWFTFALFALIIQKLEATGIKDIPGSRIFVRSLSALTVLSMIFFIPISDKNVLYYFLCFIIGGVQCILFGYLILQLLSRVKRIEGRITMFIRIAMLCFFLKNLVLVFAAVPFFSHLIDGNRFLFIAFLHLHLIGTISLGLLGLMVINGVFTVPLNIVRTFIVSFLVTEIIISCKGLIVSTTFNSISDIILLAFSALMAVCIGYMFCQTIKSFINLYKHTPKLNLN